MTGPIRPLVVRRPTPQPTPPKETEGPQTGVTLDELDLVDLLSECNQNFAIMPEECDADADDFVFHIRALQNIVLARSALRQRAHEKEER